MKLSDKIQSIAGSQTVAFTALIQQLRQEGRKIIDLAVGEPQFDTPAAVIDATKAALDAQKTRYSPVNGLPELRAQLATRFGGYDADNILLTNGSTQALFMIFQTICDPADEVIIPVSMDFLAQEGARQTVEILDEINSYSASRTEIMGVLPTFYDVRTRLSRDVLDTLREHFADKMFRTVIRTNTSLREAPSFKRTIFEYSPLSRGAFDYYQLTEEFLQRAKEEEITRP